MKQVTVQLPNSLHDTLTDRAKQEGVSLNAYMVKLLTRLTSVEDRREKRLTSDDSACAALKDVAATVEQRSP